MPTTELDRRVKFDEFGNRAKCFHHLIHINNKRGFLYTLDDSDMYFLCCQKWVAFLPVLLLTYDEKNICTTTRKLSNKHIVGVKFEWSLTVFRVLIIA